MRVVLRSSTASASKRFASIWSCLIFNQYAATLLDSTVNENNVMMNWGYAELRLWLARWEAGEQKYLWTSTRKARLTGLEGIGVIGACIKVTLIFNE